jgi:hypothetical protein
LGVHSIIRIILPALPLLRPFASAGRSVPANGEDIAEYGCQAEEYGIRANRMPNPKRLERALDARKGGGI